MDSRTATLPVYAFLLAAISGCSRPGINVEQETERFYIHQDAFEALAEISCEAREVLSSRFYRYPRDVDGDESEPARQAFVEMDELLGTIGLDTIVLRQFEGIECSLYVAVSGSSFLGEGYDFGYWYHPEDLGAYEYTEDFFSLESAEYREANRVRGDDPVKFSIELASDWYLQYYFYP